MSFNSMPTPHSCSKICTATSFGFLSQLIIFTRWNKKAEKSCALYKECLPPYQTSHFCCPSKPWSTSASPLSRMSVFMPVHRMAATQSTSMHLFLFARPLHVCRHRTSRGIGYRREICFEEVNCRPFGHAQRSNASVCRGCCLQKPSTHPRASQSSVLQLAEAPMSRCQRRKRPTSTGWSQCSSMMLQP